jgi:hypothetical protein
MKITICFYLKKEDNHEFKKVRRNQTTIYPPFWLLSEFFCFNYYLLAHNNPKVIEIFEKGEIINVQLNTRYKKKSQGHKPKEYP